MAAIEFKRVLVDCGWQDGKWLLMARVNLLVPEVAFRYSSGFTDQADRRPIPHFWKSSEYCKSGL